MLLLNHGQSKTPPSSRPLVVLCSLFLFLTNCICPSWALADKDLPDASTPLHKKDRMSRTLCAENGPRTSLASQVTLEYSVVCEVLSPSDIVLLQDGIMEAYNDFLQPLYCDPFLRRVTNVTYLSEESAKKDGSELEVRFLVEGTCQGCDSESKPSFFDAKVSDHASQHNVRQEGDETTTSCPCPDDAIANRAATQDEFLTVYESVLARDAPDLICVTPDTRGLVPTGQPSAEPTELGVDCPLNLATPLTSQLVLTLNENATQSSYEALGQDLLDTYNALINETYSTCQASKYRQMTNIRLDSEATLVQGSRMMRDRQLQDMVPSEDQLVFFQVEGGCAGCDMEELFFDPSVLSQDDFVAYYSTMVDTGLDFFKEIVTVDCPFNITSLETSVIVEYSPEDVDSDELSSNDQLQQQLEDIYVKTYNDLTLNYCDPFARQLTSAKIVLVGENNTFGNIPVLMELSGNCSNCDGLGLSVYDVPSSIFIPPNGNGTDTDAIFFEDLVRKLFPSEFPLGRAIEGGDSSCYCPAHPVGTRGVYETEFLDAYREAIHETAPRIPELDRVLQVEEDFNQGLGLEVAECEFGTEFRTGFSFGVEATADLTDDEKTILVESLKQAIDVVSTPTDELCNPEFRTVQVAELAPTQPSATRRQDVRQLPTRAPSRPSPRPAPAPSRAPALTARVVDVSIYVSGVCRQCSNQITRGDQTVGRRLVQEVEEWLRGLQAEATGTSNCFCPIGSEIAEPPTITELKTLFQEILIAAGFPYPLVSFEEVPVVDCTTPVSQFSFDFTYIVLLETDVTAAQVQAVGDVVRLIYNDVAEDFCDPYDQTIDSIELIQFSLSTDASDTAVCQEHDVTFRLTGRCRGCTPDTILSPSDTRRLSMKAHPYDERDYPLQYPWLTFANATFRKEDEMSKNPSILSGRRLQASLGDDCFCDGEVLDTRPPTVDEYNNALGVALNEFQLTNVCGLPNFVPTPEPTLEPTPEPTVEPTPEPTAEPTSEPTPAPTLEPTPAPTVTPAPTMPPPLAPVSVTLRPPINDRCRGVTCTNPLESCDPFDGLCKSLDGVIPCIAIIDESDNLLDSQVDSNWATFRAQYPDRPFCLLRPLSNLTFDRLYIPPAFVSDARTWYSNVSRDIDGANSLAPSPSDWFNICGFGIYQGSGIPYIGKFLDTSGSMDLTTVQASNDLFLATANSSNLQIREVSDFSEDWITPFLTTLVPGPVTPSPAPVAPVPLAPGALPPAGGRRRRRRRDRKRA